MFIYVRKVQYNELKRNLKKNNNNKLLYKKLYILPTCVLLHHQKYIKEINKFICLPLFQNLAPNKFCINMVSIIIGESYDIGAYNMKILFISQDLWNLIKEG